MRIKYLLYSLRPKQWIKNLFIFLPLIFGKKLLVFPDNLNTFIAFCIFSLAASSVYILNDIIDIRKDKLHPAKRLRPLASGKIGIGEASAAGFILCVVSLAASFALNTYFGYIVIAYLMFNIIYSIALKEVVIIDVFCIGLFFWLRIMAGSAVSGAALSYWIIIMTMLLALFLGFNKRRQELKLLGKKASVHRSVLMKYNLYFIDQMITVITSSIVISYMLYTVNARTVQEFGSENLIFSIPFVYYGIFRYLYLIHKVKRDGDPTRILLSDRMSQANIAAWIIVCAAIIYIKP